MESNQMSEKQEYLTVKEFAAAAGVTEQAVYKQLNRTDAKIKRNRGRSKPVKGTTAATKGR